jgi:hypothetical protein
MESFVYIICLQHENNKQNIAYTGTNHTVYVKVVETFLTCCNVISSDFLENIKIRVTTAATRDEIFLHDQ